MIGKVLITILLILAYASGLMIWYNVFVVGKYYQSATIFMSGLMLLVPLLSTFLVFIFAKAIYKF